MSFVQIQRILEAPISPRALALWMHLFTSCTTGSTELWIKQQTYADKLRCSRSTIGRTLRELIKAGLLTDLKKRHLNRFKTYRLECVIEKPMERGNKKEEGYMKKAQQEAQSVHQKICTPIQKENMNPKAQYILQSYGHLWKQKFPKLDGDSGRPYLESCVDQAILGMAQIGITRDPPSFVENWLRIATEKYCFNH